MANVGKFTIHWILWGHTNYCIYKQPLFLSGPMRHGRLDATHQESCEVNHLHFEVRYRQGLYHEAPGAGRPENREKRRVELRKDRVLLGGGVGLLVLKLVYIYIYAFLGLEDIESHNYFAFFVGNKKVTK